MNQSRKRKMLLLGEMFDEDDGSTENSLSSSDEDLEEVLVEVFKEEEECSVTKEKRLCITDYFEYSLPSYSENEFKSHFRISKELFYQLAGDYKQSAEFQQITQTYNATNHCKQLALFLWFAGHGDSSYRQLADRFEVSLWSVHKIIHRVIVFLSNMSESVIKWPSKKKQMQNARDIHQKYSFPDVIGSIHGTHIAIDPPFQEKNACTDEKGVITSFYMQGICDGQKKFIDVYIRYPGSVHESTVLKESSIFTTFPDSIQQGFYLLGGVAHPCLKFLMVPHRDNGHLSPPQKHFNQSLEKVRVQIGHTIHILKQRFPQLYYCKLTKIDALSHFVRACCVLHNLADESDVEQFQEYEKLDPETVQYEGWDETGRALRDEICYKIYATRNNK